MKIERWLGNSSSSVNGIALLRVDPNEVADIEEMLKVVDGDCVGHFGISATLVATDKCPDVVPQKYNGKVLRGYYEPKLQFGYVNASAMKKKVRYYKVFVHRD